MPHHIARALSILGHPLLILPLAVLLLLAANGNQAQRMLQVALGFAVFALVVMGYSWRQVQGRRWAHVDASQRQERRSLNRFLFLALASAAVASLWLTALRELTLGLALAAALVLVAMLGARWFKLSLHVAFATFAACLLLRIGAWAMLAGMAFAAAVAWSRLILSRHAPRDLVAGAIAGAGAGFAYWQALSRWQV